MKFLAWCIAWTFYGVGHFISLIFHKFDSLSMILYPIYNKLMIASSDISDKYGLDVWMSRQQRLNRLVDELKEMMEEDDELTIPFIIEMLLKDYDPVYVAMVAKELQQQLWDQVNLGIEVGDTVAEISAAIRNHSPDVIFPNPRVIGPVIGKEDLMSKEDIFNLTTSVAAKQLSLKRDQIRYSEPGIVDKTIKPTLENTFQEVELFSDGTEMRFEVGKAYRHSGGGEILILGKLNTFVHGDALIAEEASGHLVPVGADATHAVNWKEITLEEWNKNFS